MSERKWTGRWQSNVQWPKDAYSGFDGEGISTDLHDTEAEAKHVCRVLEAQGMGCQGWVYPIRTWVSRQEAD